MTKKSASFITSLLFLFLLSVPGFSQITEEEFTKFKLEMMDSLSNLKRDIKDNNQVLSMAEKLYDTTSRHIENGLQWDDWFFNFLNIVLVILALFVSLIGLSVFGIWRRIKNFEDKTRKEFSEQIAKSQQASTEMINRLFKSEDSTIHLKKTAEILLISKNGSDKLIELKNNALKEFNNIGELPAGSISELMDGARLTLLTKKQSELKIIVMNDELFDILETSVNDRGQKNFTDDSRKIIQAFFVALKQNNIGLIVYGNTQIRNFDLPFKAYANEPYSFYANINNLLKYMNVVLSKK